MDRNKLLLIVMIALQYGLPPTSSGQMIHTTVPFTNTNASFFESIGFHWSLRGPNWFADSGGRGPLLAPFGHPDPNAGILAGWGFSRGGVSGSLGFHAAQGSQQSISSTAASLTTMDGFPGSMTSGVVQPFVIGYTPIVGNFEGALAPLNSSRRTAAEIQLQQLSSLRQSQATLRNRKLDQYLSRAARAETDGNKRMARANYRSAIAIAPEPLRTQLRQRLAQVMAEP